MKFILGIFWGVICGIFLLLLSGYLFLVTGGMPVATKGAPLPFEKFIARTSLHAAMRGELDRASPIPADDANLRAGAKVYREQCAVCHGHLGAPKSAIAAGLFPPPPQLLPPKKGVTDDSVGETYWKVKNGIRLTGMPGFVDSLSDTQLWQVSQLLRHANELPADVQAQLRPVTQ